jgi:hypothetical protein
MSTTLIVFSAAIYCNYIYYCFFMFFFAKKIAIGGQVFRKKDGEEGI